MQLADVVDDVGCRHESGVRDSRSGRTCDPATGKQATTSPDGAVPQADSVVRSLNTPTKEEPL